jgi:hypothetical protein
VKSSDPGPAQSEDREQTQVASRPPRRQLEKRYIEIIESHTTDLFQTFEDDLYNDPPEISFDPRWSSET